MNSPGGNQWLKQPTYLKVMIDYEKDENLLREIARHCIRKAKEHVDEYGFTWDQLNGQGKKELLNLVFVDKWTEINQKDEPECRDILYSFIRCELRK